MNGVDLLQRNNASLQISMTVTKKNIDDIGNMVKKCGSLLSFAPLFKAGRARVNKQLAITGKEYYNALVAQGVNPLSYLCSSLDTAKKQKIMKCAIGEAEISISDNGDVFPCHLLHIPQFRAGNVIKDSLESIYLFSDLLKSCRQLTVLEISKCLKCPIRFICGGACRARAFYEKGRIDVSDDFCEYEKLAFMNGLFELYSLD
jgi:radical SAM protein with 4Fe4S-binding SPASM domain